MHVAFACNVHSVTQLWLIWKSSIKTKSLNTKPCPAELYPRIICKTSPLLPKLTKLLHPPGMDCFPFPLTFMGNPGDGENPTQQPKIYSFPPSQKPPLKDLSLLLSKVSFLLHQIAIFNQQSYAILICSCSHFSCIIF